MGGKDRNALPYHMRRIYNRQETPSSELPKCFNGIKRHSLPGFAV